MSSPLKQNTTTIQNLLNTINSLPDAGGVELPELSNPASAEEVFLNKEFINEDGNSVTGTFSIDNELSNQDNLISQIQTALQNKAAATGEDVTSETNAYTNKLATLETAIIALETELQGKASGGGGGIETCTVTINGVAESVNCIITQYINEEFNIIWHIPESNYTYENVVCGSGIYLAGTYMLESCTDGIILYSGNGCCYQAPTTAGATAILTLVAD